MLSESDPTDSGDPSVAWFDLAGGGWAELDDRLRSLTGDARVVVVRLPSGGRDVTSDDALAPDAVVVRERVLARLAASDTVSVALVSGRCDRDGLAIALGCDLRLAETSAEFVFSSAELFGVLGRLAASIGQTRALELCLTGRRVPAAEAASIGLVNLVVGGGQVADGVGDLTAALLATPRQLATELKRALLAASSGQISPKISLSEELAAIVRLAGDDGTRRER